MLFFKQDLRIIYQHWRQYFLLRVL